MKASTLTTFTIIVAVLSVIGGVVLGFKFKTIEVGGSTFHPTATEHFNTTIMLSAWLGTAMYTVPCLALASALENQETIMSEQAKQLQLTAKLGYNAKDTNPSASVHAAPPPVNTGDTWTCKKCGEKNPRSAGFCKSCGEYK